MPTDLLVPAVVRPADHVNKVLYYLEQNRLYNHDAYDYVCLEVCLVMTLA
jgi:hypothetical protein